MRVRKLTVASLEDRRVPSAVLVDSARATDVRANEAIVFVASPAATPAQAGQAAAVQTASSGKLAVNHNETLVLDRRRAKRGRR